MARIARVVAPNFPHHIVQRGNRSQNVFFSDNDRKAYLDYLRKYAKPAGIRFLGYCLMENHVHFIVVPDRSDSLSLGFSEVHRRYTRMVNFRENWRGYLWEGRFKSYVLSQPHFYAAMRYIECNPVKAKIVKNAWDYPWSSAKAHVFKLNDPLLDEKLISPEITDWRSFLSREDRQIDNEFFRLREKNGGRPLGDISFVEEIEKITGRSLRKQKPGPKQIVIPGTRHLIIP